MLSDCVSCNARLGDFRLIPLGVIDRQRLYPNSATHIVRWIKIDLLWTDVNPLDLLSRVHVML